MENEEQHQENAPLRAGSEEILIPPEPQVLRGLSSSGGSNRQAFKVAGLTVLACLLLASQALMAYTVYNQRDQISKLEKNAASMEKKQQQLTSSIRRSQVAPVQMHLPMMDTMPLLMDFTEDAPKKTKIPATKLENTATVSLEKQVKDLLQDQNSQLPQFNDTFLANLKSLKSQMEEPEWKGLETWMRQWLIFRMAQQSPPPPPTPTPESASSLQTKCRLEASSRGVRRLGSYRPQCDEQGRYNTMQCWHATGFCWCVDADGNVLPNTSVRGRATCDGDSAPGFRSMMAFPKMLQMEPVLEDE